MRTLLLTVCTLLVLVSPAAAQWTEYPITGVPRLPDGRPDLAAPAPRTADGKPDLSGVWWVPHHGAENDLTAPPPKYLINLAADLKPGELVMLPRTASFLEQEAQQLGKNHPMAKCLPPGIPISYTVPAPFKIIQTPALVVMLYEVANSFRQVFVDGRSLPKDPSPMWLGYSIGRWDGDSFVVESAGFNDKTWLDGMGHSHTEALRITERYTRTDVGHMSIRITIDDPGAYAKPWTTTIGAELLTDTDVMEYVCVENERSLQHMVGR
jgi:hypothetical protein